MFVSPVTSMEPVAAHLGQGEHSEDVAPECALHVVQLWNRIISTGWATL